MTAPMSFGDVAPVSATASSTARAMSSAEAAPGRYSWMTVASRSSFCGEVLAAGRPELLGGVPALLDQGVEDAQGVLVPEAPGHLGLAKLQRGLDHPERAEPLGLARLERLGQIPVDPLRRSSSMSLAAL